MKTSDEIAEMVRRVRGFESDYQRAKAEMEKHREAHEAYELAQGVVQAFESHEGCSHYKRARIDLAFALLDRAVGPYQDGLTDVQPGNTEPEQPPSEAEGESEDD